MAEVKSSLIGALLLLAARHSAASGESRAALAKAIFGRGGHFEDLAEGRRDIATGTFERAMAWFSANWPDGAEWPEDVERPAPRLPEAAE